MKKSPIIVTVLIIVFSLFKNSEQKSRLLKSSEEHFRRDDFFSGKHD